MNELIEDYLRSRGVRYFRGHHDDEFFYFVDFLVGAYRGRLNVHLEVRGARHDAVRVSISPDRFYPAEQRDRLTGLAARWNAGTPCVDALVFDSSDPALVGVGARASRRPGDLAGVTDFVDRAVDSSIELFGLMKTTTLPDSEARAGLRDAG